MVNSVTTGPLGQPHSYNWPFEGNHNADMPPSENEFDNPDKKLWGDKSLFAFR